MTTKKSQKLHKTENSPHEVVFSRRPASTKTIVVPYMGLEGKRQNLKEHGVEDVPGNVPTIRDPKRLIDAAVAPIASLSSENIGPHLTNTVQQSQILQSLTVVNSTGGSVPIPDTTRYPWRATAALSITIPGSNRTFTGTGWLVGPRAVITAGHCVFPHSSAYNGFVAQIEVHVGLDGIGNDPVCPPAIATHFACSRGWKEDGDPAYDYGLVLLDESIGDTTGWLGVSVLSDDEILGSVTNLSGYPSNSPDPATPDGKQWYVSGQPDHLDASFIYYNFGTLPGESGGALYRNVAGQSYAIGVHVASQGNLGRALRIKDGMAATLQKWASIT